MNQILQEQLQVKGNAKNNIVSLLSRHGWGGLIPIIKFIFHFNFKLNSIVYIHYTEFFGGAFFFLYFAISKILTRTAPCRST